VEGREKRMEKKMARKYLKMKKTTDESKLKYERIELKKIRNKCLK
jgi:serine protease inhibitor ecotin